MLLCFSPIGDPIRVRCRRFPALVNCVVIDWFQPWPEEALRSVAKNTLDTIDMGDDKIKEGVYPAITAGRCELQYRIAAPFQHGPPPAELWA